MLVEMLSPDFEFEDTRGKITQLVHQGFSQVNVITTKAGVFRGGHYHKENEEAFFIVSGKCVVIAEDKEGNKEKYEFKSGDMFLIEPFVMHSFDYPKDTLLVSMYSKGYELGDGRVDSYTEW